MTTLLKILISHAYDEKELAEAWKKLLETTSSHAIEVWFSSDLQATGGVPPGEDWRRDLEQRLAASNFVLAIQTPSSASRSWIMWECGVAHGIYSRQATTQRAHAPARTPERQEHGVIPIVYAMGRGELANPLTTYQIYEGEDREQVRQVCEYLLREAGLQPEEFLFKEPLDFYLRAIQAFHPRKMVTPQEMQMWRERFEQHVKSGRTHEIVSQRQIMYKSLPTPFKPTDLALHDMLSSLLLARRKYPEALEEIEYALLLARGDIHLLHRKALILAEQRNFASAEEILAQILSPHPDLRLNAEIGSLNGRIQRELWTLTGNPARLDAAIQAYLDVYEADKTQYFPGINAAELLLFRGETQRAEEILQELLTTCQRLREQLEMSYWLDFTLGEIYLGLGKSDLAVKMYEEGLGRNPPPQPRERESAARGAMRMIEQKRLPDEIKEQIRRLLSLS
jgi:tetratricopeptide (TPR) repeat protein